MGMMPWGGNSLVGMSGPRQFTNALQPGMQAAPLQRPMTYQMPQQVGMPPQTGWQMQQAPQMMHPWQNPYHGAYQEWMSRFRGMNQR